MTLLQEDYLKLWDPVAHKIEMKHLMHFSSFSSMCFCVSHSNSAAPASAEDTDQRENDRSSASPPSSSSAGRSWHFLSNGDWGSVTSTTSSYSTSIHTTVTMAPPGLHRSLNVFWVTVFFLLWYPCKTALVWRDFKWWKTNWVGRGLLVVGPCHLVFDSSR